MDNYKPKIGDKFMTITLKPEIYDKIARTQFKLTSHIVSRMLKENCSYFIMVAELTQKVNVHYHVIYRPLTEILEAVMLDVFRVSPYIGDIKVNKQPLRNDVEIERALNYIKEDLEKTDYVINHRGKKLYDDILEPIKYWDKEINKKINRKKCIDSKINILDNNINGLCVCEEHETHQGLIPKEVEEDSQQIRTESQKDRLSSDG